MPSARKFQRAFSQWFRFPGARHRMVGGNQVTLLHDGEQCLPAMLEAIAQARREILLEMYWFGSDATGRRFAQALAGRAREGLHVCVLYDAVGSYDSSAFVFELMRESGCEVHQFHPIAPWRKQFALDRVYYRDHRKILVADGRVAMTGGLNLADEWAPLAEGGKGFRDDMIRIEGPAAAQFRGLFLRTWSRGQAEAGTREAARDVSASGHSAVRVLANDYREDRRFIRRAYLQQIRHARQSITIANSYFVPDRAVRRALSRAAGRGVRVRVLVPGQIDVPPVQHASRALFDRLLRAGIELYEFSGSVLHAKSATVDDRWCTTGTFNFDHRSLRFSLEVNVAVQDEGVARAMRERLEQDIAVSRRVELTRWRDRPLQRRALERLFYSLRKFL